MVELLQRILQVSTVFSIAGTSDVQVNPRIGGLPASKHNLSECTADPEVWDASVRRRLREGPIDTCLIWLIALVIDDQNLSEYSV